MEDTNGENTWDNYQEAPLTKEAIGLWVNKMGPGNRKVLLEAIEKQSVCLLGGQFADLSSVSYIFKTYGYLLGVSLEISDNGSENLNRMYFFNIAKEVNERHFPLNLVPDDPEDKGSFLVFLQRMVEKIPETTRFVVAFENLQLKKVLEERNLLPANFIVI